tara:strand:+ start:1048 stop:1509 length:462 start_codon:yes stop_codon:yes gene_type:complete
MAITQAMCTSFKKECLLGVHRFGTNSADTFKLALYTSSASLGAATTAFTTSNQVSASGSYSSGGGSLTGVAPTTSSTTAFTDFSDISFTSATITARGAMIYNSTPSANDESGSSLTNPSCVILDFSSDKTSTSGTFTIQFPTADASNAIIRIA